MHIIRDFRRRLFFIQSYFQQPRWDTGISPPELIQFLHSHSTGKALDIGCGTGTNCITLAQNGWAVLGVDFVPKAITIARKKASLFNVTVDFRIHEIIQFMNICEDKFDLILDIGCFHSLTPNKKLAYKQNLPRLLNSSGTFLLYSFLLENNKKPFGISEQDIDSIARILHLDQRINGLDSRNKPSVWLTYRK